RISSQISLQHKALPQHVVSSVNRFQRIPSDPQQKLFIYGDDGGLLAYRAPLNDSTILDTLTASLHLLPSHRNHKFRGIDRGSYSTRHYCVWSPYFKVTLHITRVEGRRTGWSGFPRSKPTSLESNLRYIRSDLALYLL